MITAFELQTTRGGQWKINSVFEDRESALFEAKRIDGSGRYAGVRVVQENHDAESNRSQYKTIFKGGEVERANAEAYRKQKQNKAQTANQKDGEKDGFESAGGRTGQSASAESNRLYIMLTIKGAGLFLAALVLLFGLNILAQKF